MIQCGTLKSFNLFELKFKDFDFILCFSLERDPHDPAQKNQQSQDVSQKVLEIQKKLDEARDQVWMWN